MLKGTRMRKQLLCGELLPSLAKEDTRAGVSMPRCCCVSLRGNGVQEHSLLTDLGLSSCILAGCHWSCVLWLSRLAALCQAAVCEGSAAEQSRGSPAVPSRLRGRDTETQVPKQPGMKKFRCFSWSYLFIPPPLPWAHPLPHLVLALPGTHAGKEL